MSRQSKCGKPSASPPAEVYCVECATEGWERDAAAHGVVMAGDGGRVPDVSEQRSVRYTVECSTCEELDTYGYGEEYLRLGQDHKAEHPDHHVYIKAQWYLAAAAPSDPASVLAALLAESPEATVAAIEALLMGEEAVRCAERSLAASARSCLSDAEAATFALSAACRSLLSKAPKGDGDA